MPLFESALSGTAVSIVEIAVKAGKYAANEVTEAYSDVAHIQQLLAASKTYIENYRHRHCQMKILPGLMKEALDLETIYTDVKILDTRSQWDFIGQEALEEAYRKKGVRYFGDSESQRFNGMTVANDKQCLMVLGGPGIGKSTFLRKVGLEALKKDGALTHDCIPVFLELKKFRDDTIDVQAKIAQEFDICRFPNADAFVDAALEQGKLLILFDGLDEVPSSNLNRVIEKIENFVDQHSQENSSTDRRNRFVISCRSAAYRSSFRSFTDVTISEFDDEQIQMFIHRWFATEKDRALMTGDKCLELLNQDEHKATKELAQTPLLLTFICLVYDREEVLAEERCTLYGSALNIVLKEWAAQKRIQREPIYRGFHPALEQIMLAEIAHDSFQKDQLFFSREAITTRITNFLTDMLNAPKQLNADAVLEAIEVQQGILVKRAVDAYSFSHLTLQEYLAALHIVDKRLENDLVIQHLMDTNWIEVFLLVAGLMKNNVMTLLLAIERQARTYIEPHPKLQALAKWAEVNEAGPSKLYQRAASLAIASAIVQPKSVSRENRSNTIKSAIAIFSASAGDSYSAINNVVNSAISSTDAISRARAITGARKRQNQDRVAHPALQILHGGAMAGANASHSTSHNTEERNKKEKEKAEEEAKESIREIEAANISDDIININHHFFQVQKLKSITTKLKGHRRAIPGLSGSPGAWKEWARQLNLIWLDVLELDQNTIDLSLKEEKAWRNYMSANELLIKCKQAAIRISRSEWEELENRLLTTKDALTEHV